MGSCEPNGCGVADGFNVPDAPWLVWTISQAISKVTFGLVPVANTFKEACNIHDCCYSSAGNSQAYCDDQFLSNLLDACKSTISGFLDPGCEAFAYGYYEAVSDMGQNPYYTAQGSMPKGNILSCKASVIDNDELVVYVFMRNEG